MKKDFFKQVDPGELRSCRNYLLKRWLRRITAPDLINSDRENNYRADDYLLNEVGPAHLLTSIPKKRHYQSPDHGS
jgi:hypothetical protein